MDGEGGNFGVGGGGSQDAVVIIRPQRRGTKGVTADHHRAQCYISAHTMFYFLKTLRKYSGILFIYLRSLPTTGCGSKTA